MVAKEGTKEHGFDPDPETTYLSIVLFYPCPLYMASIFFFQKNTNKCLLSAYYVPGTDHIYVNSFNLKNNPEKGVSYNPKYIDKEIED